MPAAGRRDSKYVQKVHYSTDFWSPGGRVRTRCGKSVLFEHATWTPYEVTCRTCLLILDIPVGELDECGWGE